MAKITDKLRKEIAEFIYVAVTNQFNCQKIDGIVERILACLTRLDNREDLLVLLRQSDLNLLEHKRKALLGK